MFYKIQNSLKGKNSIFSSFDTYKFILLTTLSILVIFGVSFYLIDAWFSLVIVLIGITTITPICWYLANHGNTVGGRILFLTACNFYVSLGSLGCNNELDAQYFFTSISIASIVLFSPEERKISYYLIFSILFFWSLTQIDANLILPLALIQTKLPLTLFQTLSFVGSLFLSLSYLIFHVESIRHHYIKNQKETEILTQQREETFNLLTKIANNVPGVVYQYRLANDGTSSFPYSSMGIQKIYRVTPEQVKFSAEDVFKCLHPEDMKMIIESIEKSATDLTPWQCDYRVKFHDDSIEWRRGIAQPQKESDGSILWHGFITDITVEKKLERDLEQSQQAAIHASRLASLGEMAGGIAHEINTPLMIISSKTSLINQILKSETPNIERAQIELEKIKDTTFRIANIVKGLLTFARGGKQVDFQIISVDNLINDVSSLCGEKAKVEGVEIQFIADKNLNFFGNSVQISQVILNLINNSIDAISSLNKKWIKVEVQSISQSEKIRFSVSDSGLGLNQQQVERLMQPFFTTKSIGKGTGLGLSISKGLIENHGGTLTYDKTCENTRFYFDIKSGEVAKQMRPPRTGT